MSEWVGECLSVWGGRQQGERLVYDIGLIADGEKSCQIDLFLVHSSFPFFSSDPSLYFMVILFL